MVRYADRQIADAIFDRIGENAFIAREVHDLIAPMDSAAFLRRMMGIGWVVRISKRKNTHMATYRLSITAVRRILTDRVLRDPQIALDYRDGRISLDELAAQTRQDPWAVSLFLRNHYPALFSGMGEEQEAV